MLEDEELHSPSALLWHRILTVLKQVGALKPQAVLAACKTDKSPSASQIPQDTDRAASLPCGCVLKTSRLKATGPRYDCKKDCGSERHP